MSFNKVGIKGLTVTVKARSAIIRHGSTEEKQVIGEASQDAAWESRGGLVASVLCPPTSETKASSAEKLLVVSLNNVQTKEGKTFEEAPYNAASEGSSGDGAKVSIAS